MNIQIFTSYFHDVDFTSILQDENNFEFIMESSQVFDEDVEELGLELSKDQCIKGKLHLENVQKIFVNETLIQKLQKNYDNGVILDFEMEPNKVILDVLWNDFPRIEPSSIFQEIEIYAEKIYWENIPDLKFDIQDINE